MMKLSEIKNLLDAEVIYKSSNYYNIDIKFASASDLMSDVLAFAEPDALLLTGLTNNHVIRTCEITGIRAVVFVRGKKPLKETVKLSKSCNIPVLATNLSMFESCGILFANGIKGKQTGKSN